jgi:hypothetical protein
MIREPIILGRSKNGDDYREITKDLRWVPS